MTVATTTRKIQYQCDGETSEFDFPFPIQEAANISVIVTDADGVETALALTTNFEVSSDSGNYRSGGMITTVSYATGDRVVYAWASGYTITIYRSTSLLQETEFRDNRQRRYSAIETALDRVVMQIQDLNERMDRIVTVPVTDTADTLELPTATARAGKYLAFDGAGNPIVSETSVPSTAISAFAGQILDDEDAAAVKNTLGLLDPPGVLMPYAGVAAPEGWLLCYGQAVSKTVYAALFAVIGHSFGSDPGGGNFILPDMRGRVPLGKDNMGVVSANRITDAEADTIGGSAGAEYHKHTTGDITLTAAQSGLPNHWHFGGSTQKSFNGENPSSSGAIYGNTAGVDGGAKDATTAHNHGDTQTVDHTMPYLTLNWIIKT